MYYCMIWYYYNHDVTCLLTDADNLKQQSLTSLVQDTLVKGDTTYLYTDLQYVEHRTFFWGKAAKYGQYFLYYTFI